LMIAHLPLGHRHQDVLVGPPGQLTQHLRPCAGGS
jgi:hypothetical protein